MKKITVIVCLLLIAASFSGCALGKITSLKTEQELLEADRDENLKTISELETEVKSIEDLISQANAEKANVEGQIKDADQEKAELAQECSELRKEYLSATDDGFGVTLEAILNQMSFISYELSSFENVYMSFELPQSVTGKNESCYQNWIYRDNNDVDVLYYQLVLANDGVHIKRIDIICDTSVASDDIINDFELYRKALGLSVLLAIMSPYELSEESYKEYQLLAEGTDYTSEIIKASSGLSGNFFIYSFQPADASDDAISY